MDAEWVRIATVRSVNPARRELRLKPDEDHGHALGTDTWLHVRPRGAAVKRCKAEAIREMGEGWQAILAPGVPRDLIGALNGAAVLMPAADYAQVERPLRPRDLIGMTVLNADGETLGDVTEVYEGAANAAFTVEKKAGGTLTLPLIEEVFLEFDPDRRRLQLGDVTPYAVDSDAD